MSHIEINVSNLENSRVFYAKVFAFLGFSLYQEWDLGFSYRKDNFYVVFVQAEARFLPSSYHRSQVGLNHLAFSHDSFEALMDFKATLIEMGVSLLYEDRFPYAGGDGLARLYFEDPDRIKVEVVVDDASC